MKLPTINEVISSRERFDYSKVRLTRSDAIRRHCLDCMGFQRTEVENCQDEKCPLWRFRTGKEINDEFNPKKEYTPEELDTMRERMKKLNKHID